ALHAPARGTNFEFSDEVATPRFGVSTPPASHQNSVSDRRASGVTRRARDALPRRRVLPATHPKYFDRWRERTRPQAHRPRPREGKFSLPAQKVNTGSKSPVFSFVTSLGRMKDFV